MKILTVPFPILLGAVAFQIPSFVDSTPAWIAAFFIGAYVVVWLLDKFGMIPRGWRNGAAPVPFTQEDQKNIRKIKDIVTRDDPNEPGWPILWSHWRECRDCKAVLASLNNIVEDHHRVNNATLETLQSLQDFLKKG